MFCAIPWIPHVVREFVGCSGSIAPGHDATITLVVERRIMASNVQNGFVADGGVGSGVALGRNVSSHNGDDGRSLQGTAQGAPSENIVQRNSERPVLSSATDSNGSGTVCGFAATNDCSAATVAVQSLLFNGRVRPEADSSYLPPPSRVERWVRHSRPLVQATLTDEPRP
jgi:hypothetical protein